MNIKNLFKDAELKAYVGHPSYEGSTWNLSKIFGAARLGFHLEVMDPKQFSAPYHYHTDEEEFFFVLEGEAIVRRNGQFRKVGPGDLIFYGVGADTVHNMYNHTDKPFKFLAVSNNSTSDVCYYPDSNKVNAGGNVTQNGAKVDYFKDETDPAKYWPDWALRGEV